MSMIETGQPRNGSLMLSVGSWDGKQDVDVQWEMLWGDSPYGATQAGSKGWCPIPAWNPVPKHRVCVVPTLHLPFSISEDFTLTRVWGLGELINHTMAALTPKPPAIFSHALDLAEKSLQFLVLLGYLRHDRYRDLVLILSAVRRYH